MAGASRPEIVVIGAGAAGIAAARRLHDAGVSCLMVEARDRLGGRAWTRDVSGHPLDLGCGWLHSADRNPWTEIAETSGFTIDRTPPPWSRPALGFPPADRKAFRDAANAFYERLDEEAEGEPDRPAAEFLEPGGRWNGLLHAVSTYVNGVELDGLSAHDFGRYRDSGVNWRVAEGYGRVIAAHGANLPVVFDCPVERIDHGGAILRIETAKGTLQCGAAIVTVPTGILAEETLRFFPALPDKVEAAAGLPLGLADKLFLALDGADDFEAETRVYGRTDRARTGSYHLRPFGRPLIEAYFGGSLARELEAGGEAAFMSFSADELAAHLGSGIKDRMRPIAASRWGRDPFSRGSYSHARPGRAEARAVLAAPVEDRLFFAGEACSTHDFSTAHGAYLTGIAVAEQAMSARGRAP